MGFIVETQVPQTFRTLCNAGDDGIGPSSKQKTWPMLFFAYLYLDLPNRASFYWYHVSPKTPFCRRYRRWIVRQTIHHWRLRRLHNLLGFRTLYNRRHNVRGSWNVQHSTPVLRPSEPLAQLLNVSLYKGSDSNCALCCCATNILKIDEV